MTPARNRFVRSALGSRFESLAQCKLHRVKVVKALACDDCGLQLRDTCTNAHRCKSGLCPICVRLLRKELRLFAGKVDLSQRDWFFVTIRFEVWDMAPGHQSAFGRLRDHSTIKGVIRNMMRQPGPVLLVVGSIETVYITIDNRPVAKPFHVHLLISGRTEDQIKGAVGNRITRTEDQPFPLDIKKVGPTQDDFLRVLGYAFKQPFWKKSKRHASDKGRAQFPKAGELRELASNYGVHGWSGRLILCGIRFSGRKFAFTDDLSSSSNTATGAS